MTSFEDTRRKIRDNIKNETLRIWAIQLANSIEYMANCNSNHFDEVKSFDRVRIKRDVRRVGGD